MIQQGGKVDKKRLVEMFIASGIVGPNFTGKVVLNFNQGGVTDIEKTEKIK